MDLQAAQTRVRKILGRTGTADCWAVGDARGRVRRQLSRPRSLAWRPVAGGHAIGVFPAPASFAEVHRLVVCENKGWPEDAPIAEEHQDHHGRGSLRRGDHLVRRRGLPGGGRLTWVHWRRRFRLRIGVRIAATVELTAGFFGGGERFCIGKEGDSAHVGRRNVDRFRDGVGRARNRSGRSGRKARRQRPGTPATRWRLRRSLPFGLQDPVEQFCRRTRPDRHRPRENIERARPKMGFFSGRAQGRRARGLGPGPRRPFPHRFVAAGAVVPRSPRPPGQLETHEVDTGSEREGRSVLTRAVSWT
mmetsp:Transcript_7590/g.18304  ORF Transcript_7590/g.18304 Transcript_7590/m.18304 type:complete len:304 (-) Transcript_7590:2376-3287(-)